MICHPVQLRHCDTVRVRDANQPGSATARLQRTDGRQPFSIYIGPLFAGQEAARPRRGRDRANTGPMTANSPILEGLLVHVSLGIAGLRYARKPGG
jgi:hypothetical protein